MGLEQSLGAAGWNPRQRADDLVRNRDGPRGYRGRRHLWHLKPADSDSMDDAALSLRPVDAPGMEAAGTARAAEPGGDRNRGGAGGELKMPLWLFVFLAALAVLSALGVILQRNLVHCLMALVMVLLDLAVMFIGLGAVTVGF